VILTLKRKIGFVRQILEGLKDVRAKKGSALLQKQRNPAQWGGNMHFSAACMALSGVSIGPL
jgi:hypothetical protein